MTERTTIEPIGEDIMEEMEQALQDREAQRDERGLEADPKGMRLSQKTNITHGSQVVAGRTRAWRTDDGRETWLNTGELPYHLSKRRPNGDRVFVLKKPVMAQRAPLEIQCQTCLRMNGYSRQFFSRSQYEDHQEILHPREYQRELRNDERSQRERETNALVALAERGAGNVRTEQAEQSTEEGGNWVCAGCHRGFRSKAALGSHARTHA